MRSRVRPLAACLLIVPLLLVASTPPAHAIHFYRGPGQDCTPADGSLPAPVPPEVTVGAVVEMGHNTFRDTVTGFSFDGPAETHITAGEAVTWTWNSSHCHSIDARTGAGFYSGFHYPTTPPESPKVADEAFAYPILDDTPTLSFTYTFASPGTYEYVCEHHASIGMTGKVIVAP